MRGSLDVALPLWPEESPATPVSRAAPWTPVAAASLFRCWDLARGHVPPPRGGFGTVACVEATAITGGAAVTGGAAAVTGGAAAVTGGAATITGGAAAVTGGYGGGVMGP